MSLGSIRLYLRNGARAVGCAGVTAGFTSAAVLSSPAPPAVDAGARLSVTYGPATLAGTNIVIFGGSSGIGKAIALGAAQQGAATVHIIGRDDLRVNGRDVHGHIACQLF